MIDLKNGKKEEEAVSEMISRLCDEAVERLRQLTSDPHTKWRGRYDLDILMYLAEQHGDRFSNVNELLGIVRARTDYEWGVGSFALSAPFDEESMNAVRSKIKGRALESGCLVAYGNLWDEEGKTHFERLHDELQETGVFEECAEARRSRKDAKNP